MKIRKGDQVKIISGNDKGKQGKVTAVFTDAGKIVVEGMNIKKKHVKAKQQGKKGELVKMPAAMPASRVMLVCNKCNQTTRVGFKLTDGKKYRICKKCGAEI